MIRMNYLWSCERNSFILLLVIVHLVCLVYKLNFIISRYRKKIVYIVFGTVYGSRHPLGVLEHIP
jgi:hypothetical protein